MLQVKKIIVEPFIGTHLSDVARKVIKLAKKYNCEVMIENFNGINLHITPTDTVSSVTTQFRVLWQRSLKK